MINSDYLCIMKAGKFHFKQFSVGHGHGSMKVGVDGVMVGAWSSASGKRILDAGTGCGLIALMLAQRNHAAEILGIDIDSASVDEAQCNFKDSPWSDRLQVRQESYVDFSPEGCGFDLIVSNPPYFDSGVTDLTTTRIAARHQGEFSPYVLLERSPKLLADGGRVAMIVPSEFFDKLRDWGISLGLVLVRAMFVRNHPEASVKRVLMEFSKDVDEGCHVSVKREEVPMLTMFQDEGIPTDDYRNLCGDFYLKF